MSDGDLHEMYKRYKKRSDILLWIKQSTKLEASASQKTSKYETQVNKMTNKLCKKHGERYTKEQTRGWAVLIHMGKLRVLLTTTFSKLGKFEVPLVV